MADANESVIREYLEWALEAAEEHWWFRDPDDAIAALDALAAGAELSDPDANVVGKHQRPGAASETQRLAALQVCPRTGTARRRVLDLLSVSYIGKTDEEIQAALFMNPSTERPRRVELVEGGWVEDSGIRRATQSGSEAVVWRLTDKAMAEL